MGKMSRNKGAAFERAIAQRLTIATGKRHERNLEEVRSGLSSDIVQTEGERLPFTWQLKVGASPSVWRALDEAEAAASPTDCAVAVVRRNRAPGRKVRTVAILDFEDFLELLGERT